MKKSHIIKFSTRFLSIFVSPYAHCSFQIEMKKQIIVTMHIACSILEISFNARY